MKNFKNIMALCAVCAILGISDNVYAAQDCIVDLDSSVSSKNTAIFEEIKGLIAKLDINETKRRYLNMLDKNISVAREIISCTDNWAPFIKASEAGSSDDAKHFLAQFLNTIFNSILQNNLLEFNVFNERLSQDDPAFIHKLVEMMTAIMGDLGVKMATIPQVGDVNAQLSGMIQIINACFDAELDAVKKLLQA